MHLQGVLSGGSSSGPVLHRQLPRVHPEDVFLPAQPCYIQRVSPMQLQKVELGPQSESESCFEVDREKGDLNDIGGLWKVM